MRSLWHRSEAFFNKLLEGVLTLGRLEFCLIAVICGLALHSCWDAVA